MFFYIFVASNNIQLKGGRQLLYSRLFGFFSPQCNGLSLAVHKTEAVRISSRRSRRKYCTSRFKQHLVKPVYQVSRGTDQPKTVLQNSPWICTRKSIKIEWSRFEDNAQHSRTEAAQQANHGHNGDLDNPVQRAHIGRARPRYTAASVSSSRDGTRSDRLSVARSRASRRSRGIGIFQQPSFLL